MTFRQISDTLGVHGKVHLNHFGEKVQRQRGFRFLSVDKITAIIAAPVIGVEGFTHRPVPVHYPKDAGKLVTFLELLDGRF